ncbi:MAG: WYL domain-containing protein [Bacillota bacterium]
MVPVRDEESSVAKADSSREPDDTQGPARKLDFLSAEDPKALTQDPYHLRLFDGAWYCIGYCHERREVRTFALDRMTALQVTGETFTVPDDFSVEEYLAGSLGMERGAPRKVVIEFDPSEAPYIRGRRWHRSQTLEEMPDGTLRMSLTVGGLGEVMRWVMSLGSHAWVVEPEELREKIAAEIEKVRERYSARLGSSK